MIFRLYSSNGSGMWLGVMFYHWCDLLWRKVRLPLHLTILFWYLFLNPKTLSDFASFRPISLCNFVYKIVTEVLVNCLKRPS